MATKVKKRQANGRGSVRRRADGRYEGRVSLGTSDDGKQIQKSVYGRTAAETQTKMIELQASVGRGEKVQKGRGPTFGAYAEEWYANQLGTKVWEKPATSRLQRHLLDTYLIPALGRIRLKDIDRPMLARLRDRLANTPKQRGAGNLADRTINHALGTVRAVLNAAVDDGHVLANPAAGKGGSRLRIKVNPGQNTKKAKPITTAERPAFLEMCASHRDGALWILLAGTGAREGEALGLQWGDITWGDGATPTVIHIERELRREKVKQPDGTVRWVDVLQGLKTGHKSIRDVPVRSTVTEYLRQHEARQREERLRGGEKWIKAHQDYGDLVFTGVRDGRPRSGAAVYSLWARALRAAGLPARRIHDCRVSLATWGGARKVDPRLMALALGQSASSVASVTLDTYTQQSRELNLVVADVAEEWLAG